MHARTRNLDGQYTHLIDQVIFKEKKRVRKVMRCVVLASISRPPRCAAGTTPSTCSSSARTKRSSTSRNTADTMSSRCSAENIALLNREQLAYEMEVDAAYQAMLSYTPVRRPLWTKVNGFSTRSREDTQRVIIEIATTGEVEASAAVLPSLSPCSSCRPSCYFSTHCRCIACPPSSARHAHCGRVSTVIQADV